MPNVATWKRITYICSQYIRGSICNLLPQFFQFFFSIFTRSLFTNIEVTLIKETNNKNTVIREKQNALLNSQLSVYIYEKEKNNNSNQCNESAHRFFHRMLGTLLSFGLLYWLVYDGNKKIVEKRKNNTTKHINRRWSKWKRPKQNITTLNKRRTERIVYIVLKRTSWVENIP